MSARPSSWAVSLFAHGGIAAALIVGVPWPEPPGAVDEGLQGIEVMLSAGGAPGQQTIEPVKPDIVEQRQPEPSPPAEPEKVVEKPVEPPPEPEKLPEPEKAPEIIASKSAEPDIEVAPKPEKKPVAKPSHRPWPKPVREAVEPADSRPEPSKKTELAASPAAPLPAVGRSGEQAAPNAGNGAAATSGGNPGVEADYYARLLAWLEEKKDYPARAQMRRMQGIAHLRFIIDGQGNVLRYQIERSSGHRLLDQAVEKMIEKADPLPPIPAELAKDRLDLVVPVQFLLK